MKYGIALKMQ